MLFKYIYQLCLLLLIIQVNEDKITRLIGSQNTVNHQLVLFESPSSSFDLKLSIKYISSKQINCNIIDNKMPSKLHSK